MAHLDNQGIHRLKGYRGKGTNEITLNNPTSAKNQEKTTLETK